MTPLDLVLAKLEEKGCRGRGRSWQCPAHEDHRASLSVREGRDGCVLLKCHSGCPTEHVVAALGLEMTDLFPSDRSHSALAPRGSMRPVPAPKTTFKARAKDEPRGQIVATYPYVDETGALLYEVVRYSPKDFRQRRPDPKNPGRYVWNVDGIRRVLYRLPGVVAAANAGGLVFVVEGEKDADALVSLGLVATCNAGGADDGKGSKWRPEFAPCFAGADVCIIADKDSPGRAHARYVAAQLLPIAKSVKLVEVPVGKDPADWVAAGATREDFKSLAAATVVPVSSLLADVVAFIKRFMVLSDEQVLTCALWVLHAHAIEAADTTPYLCVTSPLPRCGKTRLIEVLELLVPKPFNAVLPSDAVAFRVLDEGVTLLLDEYDAIFKAGKDYEGLRGILNAGHRRGATVPRCVDHGKEIVRFKVFGPKCIAGISDPPTTVKDRSFVIALKRKAPGQMAERFSRRDVEPTAVLLQTALSLAFVDPTTIDALRHARPEMPKALDGNDRARDGAEPLLAIADLAGGEWPARARHALVSLAGEAALDDETDYKGATLLRDLRSIFLGLGPVKGASTEFLLARLHQIKTSPWSKWERGDPLDHLGLARLLRAFRVRPKKKRWNHGEEPRGGYLRAEVLEAATTFAPALPDEAEEEAEAPDAATSSERSERRNEPSAGAAPSRSEGVGTDLGTASSADPAGPNPAAPWDGPDFDVAGIPFRPPFRVESERLGPLRSALRSGVPSVPSPDDEEQLEEVAL